MFSRSQLRAILGATALLPLVLLTSLEQSRSSGEPGRTERNRYIGAEACKKCHDSEEKGSTHDIWEKSKHANAWKVLSTAKAKEVAAKHSVDGDPQKSDQCLTCHVTGHGAQRTEKMRNFDKTLELGVQCESCHGPGENHQKARFKEASSGEADSNAYVKIPANEIIAEPPMSTCLECHNKEKSPTFKPFCFKERNAEIAHLDPRKKRTKEQLEAMKCGCGDSCKCEQGECSKTKEAKADK